LHYGIIHSNNSNLILSSSLPFINHDKLPKRFTLINEGDLILADTSEDRKDAAKGIEIINQSNAHILSGLHTLHLREKAPCTIPGFKTYYVASKSFRNFARKYCEGIKVFSIKQSLLKYTHFAYPQNKNEQFMIVDFLNKIEDKKAILEKKINILKKYKKGMQKNIFDSSKTKENLILKNIVKLENKSKIPANSSIENGNYILYKSGQKNGMINDYSHEGVYIIANDGGIAQFKLTSGKFAYTDHCICFRCQSDEETIVLCNYLQSLEKKITYVGFTGTGLKNIDRQYLGMIKIPKVDNKKIAKSFNLIDKAIRNYENILERIIIIKKLLLKQMFI
jgi:type I restriction enzyme S subunit